MMRRFACRIAHCRPLTQVCTSLFLFCVRRRPSVSCKSLVWHSVPSTRGAFPPTIACIAERPLLAHCSLSNCFAPTVCCEAVFAVPDAAVKLAPPRPTTHVRASPHPVPDRHPTRIPLPIRVCATVDGWRGCCCATPRVSRTRPWPFWPESNLAQPMAGRLLTTTRTRFSRAVRAAWPSQ